MSIVDASGRPVVSQKACSECGVIFAGDVCPVCSSRETTNRTVVNIIAILEKANLIKAPNQKSKKRRSGRVN